MLLLSLSPPRRRGLRTSGRLTRVGRLCSTVISGFYETVYAILVFKTKIYFVVSSEEAEAGQRPALRKTNVPVQHVYKCVAIVIFTIVMSTNQSNA